MNPPRPQNSPPRLFPGTRRPPSSPARIWPGPGKCHPDYNEAAALAEHTNAGQAAADIAPGVLVDFARYVTRGEAESR